MADTSNTGPAGTSISALLRKTEHYDKDERYMATSDLCEVLKRQSNNDMNINNMNMMAANAAATTTQQQQQQQQQQQHMDKTTERQVCTAVLRLLHDKSNDVQAIAVKTLGVLLTTVGESQVLEIADSLADQVLDADKSELRDVYAIGLRTLCKTCPVRMGDRVAHRLTGRLLDGIRTLSKTPEIVLACLDVLTDLLSRFGATSPNLQRQHEAILQMCLSQLCASTSSGVVRKRAGNTLACLSTCLSDALLMRMVESLLTQIDKGSKSSKTTRSTAAATAVDTRALIRTMCTVSGAVGHRLGQEQVDRILPIFLRFTNPQDAVTGDDDQDGDNNNDANNDNQNNNNTSQDDDVDMMMQEEEEEDEAAQAAKNELRESCFVGFESFVLQCPLHQVEPHLEKILQASLAYMAYDPNYSYGNDDEEEHNENSQAGDDDNVQYDEEEDDDEYEEEDDDEDEDDDDESWKVRRGAVRALKAVVEALRENPTSLWTKSYDIRRGQSSVVAAALVARFKEREENCRVGLMDCFNRLLQVTIAASDRASASASAAAASSVVVGGGSGNGTGNKSASSKTTTVAPTTAVTTLRLVYEGEDSDNNNNNMATEQQQQQQQQDPSVVTIDLHKSEYASKVVKACEKILSQKKGNERSKSSALALLATFCKAPGGIGGQAAIMSVFTHVQPFLASSSSSDASSTAVGLTSQGGVSSSSSSKALRLDALSLLHTLFAEDKNHNPVHIRICLIESSQLLPELCMAVKEQWYKVIAEALRALANVPPFFVVGYTDADTPQVRSTQRAKVAEQLYEAMEPLLAAHDVDQEIKECALRASASLLSNLHASLEVNHKDRLLVLLLERLKNETTRIAAIKNLAVITGSGSGSSSSTTSDAMEEDDESLEQQQRIDLSPILADAISQMSSFLKLQSRSLKQSTLEAMDVLVTNHGSLSEFSNGELFSAVCQDFSPLVLDTDLHLSHLTLRCTVSVLQACPAAGPAVKAHVLEPAMVLATSSLLQDLALESLLLFFKQLVLSKAVEFDDLLFLLRQRLDEKVGKQGIYNLAKCIATIAVATTPENGQAVLNEILTLLESSSGNTLAESGTLRQVQLGLLITGDLGRMMDLSSSDAGGAADRLKPIYMSYFDSSSEDLKHAAAYALGNAAVCAHTTFIPAIVSKLDEDNKKQQYLLLSALRGFIQCSAAAQKSSTKTTSSSSAENSLTASLPKMLPPLEKHCAEEEEGVRTMVAECLGSLTCIEPALMLKKLAELQTAHSPAEEEEVSKEVAEKNALVCWTVATSVKLAIAGRVDPAQLSIYMPTFVQLLNHKELHVRNAALLLVYSAVHHMPQVVSGLLQDVILPALFEVSNLKLQRMVDFGPFKHYVDDALPLRKAALSIFATCLESLPGALDVASFMPVLAKALGDAEDIQLHAHQIVISMCSRRSTFLSSSVVDTFVEPLEKTMKKKAGTKTGTELERLNDWIKSALRVMLALSKVEGVMTSRKFTEFVERTKADPKFTQMLQALQEES